MGFMRLVRLLILALCLYGCSCSSDGSRGALKVGIDPNWYPLDFGTQTSYVNGFTEELLMEVAHYSGMRFELISTNWDSLFEGLKEKRYDAILTSMPPHEYHVAQYDFSMNFLDLGPVLVIREGGKRDALDRMDGELVGVVTNDPAETLVAKHPAIIIRSYSSVPELLNAVVEGDIEAAVLGRIPAVNFVGDLYASKLKIVGKPMTDQGLHLVALKGKGKSFNRHLESLQKRRILDRLLKKWSL